MPVKTKQTEADLQRAILGYLATRQDVFAMRVNAGGFKTASGAWIRGAPAGTSDIIGWCEYREFGEKPEYTKAIFLAIEVKTPKGRVSAVQQAYLDKVNAAGGLGFVARSIDDVVKQLGRCP